MSEGGWCELLSCTLFSVECVLYNRGGGGVKSATLTLYS